MSYFDVMRMAVFTGISRLRSFQRKKTIKRRIKRRGKAVCSCSSRIQSFCGQQIIHISAPFHWCREKQKFGPYVTIESEQQAILSKEVLPIVSLVLYNSELF